MNEIQAVKTAKIEEVKKNSKKRLYTRRARSSNCNPCNSRSYCYSGCIFNNRIITEK